MSLQLRDFSAEEKSENMSMHPRDNEAPDSLNIVAKVLQRIVLSLARCHTDYLTQLEDVYLVALQEATSLSLSDLGQLYIQLRSLLRIDGWSFLPTLNQLCVNLLPGVASILEEHYLNDFLDTEYKTKTIQKMANSRCNIAEDLEHDVLPIRATRNMAAWDPMWVVLPASWEINKMVDEKFSLLDLLQIGLPNTLFVTYAPEDGLMGITRALEKIDVSGENVTCHIFVSLTKEQRFKEGHLNCRPELHAKLKSMMGATPTNTSRVKIIISYDNQHLSNDYQGASFYLQREIYMTMLRRLGLCVFDNEDIWSRIAVARDATRDLQVDQQTVWIIARAIVRTVLNQRMLSRWIQWSGITSTDATGSYTHEEQEYAGIFDEVLLETFGERDVRNPVPTRPSMSASGATPHAPPSVRPPPRSAANVGQGTDQDRWENLYKN
jgi:hypothetical protein